MNNGFNGLSGRLMRGYTLQGGHIAINPLDSTVYYYGSLFGLVTNTTPDLARLYTPVPGIIRAVINFWSAVGTAGSAEAISWVLRLNNEIDIPIATIANTNANKVASNLSLNVPVKAGMYAEMKMTTPNFGTNPTNVRNAVVIFVET